MKKTSLDIEHLFASISPDQPVALGISGGADSMAMMYLFASWRTIHPLPHSVKDLVLSVDHGLRPEAADEVAFVKVHALELGFDVVPVALEGLHSGAGVQVRARGARYEAMTGVMKEKGLAHLLTAHTLDDQAETFLMRLKRGSGLEGLSAILPDRELYGVRLLRPLLSVSKNQLIEYLQSRELNWCEDPSNQDLAYERVEVRTLLDKLDGNGDLRSHIGESARRLSEARAALEVWVDDFFSSHVVCRADGLVQVNGAAFDALPFAVQLMVVQSLLAAFGRRSAMATVEQALVHILSMKLSRFALGGVMIRKNDIGDYHYFREVGRAPLEELTIDGDQPGVIWDKRVELRFSPGRVEPVLVRAFFPDEGELLIAHYKNQAHYKNLSSQNSSSTSLPALDVLLGLATIWTVGENSALLAVPQLETEIEHEVLQALNEGSGADMNSTAGSLKLDVGLPLMPLIPLAPLSNF